MNIVFEFVDFRIDFTIWMCDNKAVKPTKGWVFMAVSYNKLCKLLIDKNMKKTDLRVTAGISSGTLAKLGKNESVTTDILVRICHALNCDIGDIMEVLPEEVS